MLAPRWCAPSSVESSCWSLRAYSSQEDVWADVAIRRSFRRKVLELVASGADQTIYTWRRQERIDQGLEPGLTSSERAELAAAKRRIAELENELAAHGKATELLGKVVPPKGGSRPSR